MGRGAPSHRHLVAGVERADSWATDAHKWLNVPYDAGLAFVAHPQAHHAAFGASAAYLPRRAPRCDGLDAGVLAPRPLVRDLGRAALARARRRRRAGRALLRAARGASPRCLGASDGVEVLNDVVLNQVLVRFGDDDDVTDAVVAAVQAEGTCWAGPTTWRGRRAMRISVSNWATTVSDVDRSCAAILAPGAWGARGRSFTTRKRAAAPMGPPPS